MPIIGLEWIWIVLIIIIFLVGPKKLPEVAKMVGKAMGEFQKARQQIETEFKSASEQIDNEVKSATDVVKDTTEIVKDATSNLSEVGNRKNLFDAAQALGIFAYGKTNDELSRMIKEKVDEKNNILSITQEGGQQGVQATVKTDNSPEDSSISKSTDQQTAVITRQKNSPQKLKKTKPRKIKVNAKLVKERTNTTTQNKSKSNNKPKKSKRA